MPRVAQIVKEGPVSNVELIEVKESGWYQYRAELDGEEHILASLPARTRNFKELEDGDIVKLTKGTVSPKLKVQTYLISEIGGVSGSAGTPRTSTKSTSSGNKITGKISDVALVKVDEKSGYAKYMLSIGQYSDIAVGLKKKHVEQGIKLDDGMELTVIKHERGFLVADESFVTKKSEPVAKKTTNNAPVSGQTNERVITGVTFTEVPDKGYDIYELTFSDGGTGKVFAPPRSFAIGQSVNVEEVGKGRVKVADPVQTDVYAERLDYDRSTKDPEIGKRGWAHIYTELLVLAEGNFDLAENYIDWVHGRVGNTAQLFETDGATSTPTKTKEEEDDLPF